MSKPSIGPWIALLTLFLPACSSLLLDRVDFAWPVESVQTVNSMDRIEEGRYALTVNVLPLALAEFADSTALRGSTLHIIRNGAGFYFITGPQFKHVYVFKPGDGALILSEAIPVSATGLGSPAFNQRPPYIELLDGSAPARRLTSTALLEGNGR